MNYLKHVSGTNWHGSDDVPRFISLDTITRAISAFGLEAWHNTRERVEERVHATRETIEQLVRRKG